MGIKEDIFKLVTEMYNHHLEPSRSHRAPAGQSFPDFSTARNGNGVTLPPSSRALLTSIAGNILSNDITLTQKIELPQFITVVRQCFVDFYAEGKFKDGAEADIYAVKSDLVAYAKEAAADRVMEFTHYFPAWTLGIERVQPFQLGPVTFLTREQFVENTDIQGHVKDSLYNQGEANHRWKEIIRERWGNPSHDGQLDGFARDIFEAIGSCPSILKITLVGYEKNLSKKLAAMICRSALDAVSLVFGNAAFFQQQTLAEERLSPIKTSTITETNGYLWLPGMALGKRIPQFSPARISEDLKTMPELMCAIGYTLGALANPKLHRHPELASRWAIALDWFAEGHREQSDAIGLAKIATSLDGLACVGTYKGILELLENLLDIKRDGVVINGRKSRTLAEVVKEIYDDGRSKILHGSYSNRLQAYGEGKSRASYLGRHALIESVLRLENYIGADKGTAFRTMKRNAMLAE